MKPPVATASVHGDSHGPQAIETFLAQVLAVLQRPNDPGEDDELLLLRTQKRLCLEEGDDPFHEVNPVTYHVHQGGVRGTAMVLTDPSAAEPSDDQVEDLSPFRRLTDMELRDELPTNSCARVPLDGDVERPFSIDKACDVGVQSFLLIVRT